MKTAAFLTEEELIKKAAEILIEKLGEVEAIRFFSLPKKKRMKSVERHKSWQESLHKEAFFVKPSNKSEKRGRMILSGQIKVELRPEMLKLPPNTGMGQFRKIIGLAEMSQHHPPRRGLRHVREKAGRVPVGEMPLI